MDTYDLETCPLCLRHCSSPRAVNMMAQRSAGQERPQPLGLVMMCSCACSGSRKEWYICVACTRHQSSHAEAIRTKAKMRRHLRSCLHNTRAARDRVDVAVEPDSSSDDSSELMFPVDSAGDELNTMELANEPTGSAPVDQPFAAVAAVQPSGLECSQSLREYVDILAKVSNGKFDIAAATSVLRPATQSPGAVWCFPNDLRKDALRRLSLYLRVGTVASELGQNKMLMFASIIHDLLLDSSEDEKKELVRKIAIPSTVPNFVSNYFNRTNSASLMSIVPSPLVRRIEGTDLSHVALSDAVYHAMIMPPKQEPIDHSAHRCVSLAESSRIAEYLRMRIRPSDSSAGHRVDLLVVANIWSDGWDPNRLSKSNRGSVWTCTACLVVYKVVETMVTPIRVVNQVLCAGTEKEDHDPHFRVLLKEWKSELTTSEGHLLPHTCIARLEGRGGAEILAGATVHIALGAVVQDNPERRTSAGLSHGNSNFHPLFGTSCNFGRLRKPFEACAACIRRLLSWQGSPSSQLDFDTGCEQCLCWDASLLEGAQYVPTNQPGIEFLSEEDPGHSTQVGPTKLSFPKLTEVWEFATRRYCYDRIWTTGNIKSYLKLHCVNDKTVDGFLTMARQHILRMERNDPRSPVWESEEHRLEVLGECQSNPNAMGAPTPPSAWALFKIGDLIETPMHLAMNCQKAVLRTCIKYCSTHNRGAEFCRRASSLLVHVKSMKLERARTLPFKDEKFGGYVAENYAACCMLFPWISQLFYDHAMLPGKKVTLPDPRDKSYDKWNMEENKEWLRLRGIAVEKGINAADLKSIVFAWRDDPECPEPMEEDDEDSRRKPSTEPPDTIRSLLLSCHLMFQALFSNRQTGEAGRNRALLRVRVFLSIWNEVDLMALPHRDKPIHVAKYNTLGLLRSCDIFLLFNAVVNMHEGGAMGEGVVKDLREMCPPVARDNWSANLVAAFHRDATMDLMMHDLETTFDDDPGSDREELRAGVAVGPSAEASSNWKDIRRSARRYKLFERDGAPSLEHPGRLIRDGKPLSVVVHRRGGNGRDNLIFSMLTRDGFLGIDILPFTEDRDPSGFIYHNVRIAEEIVPFADDGSADRNGVPYDRCGLMLPDLRDSSTDHRKCCVISLSWEWYDGFGWTEEAVVNWE